MRNALAVILIIVSSLCHGQSKKDTVIRYFDVNLEPVKKREAVFVGVTVRDAMGWNCLIYDDSIRVLVRGKYKDDDCKIKDGWFMYYYADGKRAAGGRFANNIRVDNWKTWHPNGTLKDSAIYENGDANGASRSYHDNGKLAAEGIYVKGLMDGAWTFYHDNGNPSTKELYKGGKLADLECFDTLGNSKGINCAIARPPTLVGRYGGIQKYLADSLKMQGAYGDYVEGFVTVQYTITKEGRLVNFRIISTEHLLLSREVTRVFGGITDWYPAVSHGRNIDYTVTLNIPFFVNDPRGMERFQPMENFWE